MTRGGTRSEHRIAARVTGRSSRGRTWSTAVLIAAVLSLAALAMCDYAFGTADQLQYLVQVMAIEHPGVLGDDPYLRAFTTLRSFFWPAITAISDEASRPVVCLAVSFLAAALGALLLMKLGTILAADGKRHGIDLVAGTAAVLVLVVPKEQNWFGLVSLSDLELTATSAVIPLVIGSLLAWAAGRPLVSLLVAMIAATLHLQTAAYLLTTWTCVALWSGRGAPKRLILPMVVGVIGLVAVVRERASNAVDPAQLDGLEEAGILLYKELISPWTASLAAWGVVVAILALGGLAAVALFRAPHGPSRPQRAVLAWAIASIAFPAVGLALLGLGLRDPLLWRLMVGRSLMLPQIAALILFAAWAARTMQRGGPAGVTAVIALAAVTCWPFPAWPNALAAAGLALTLGCVAIDAILPGWGVPGSPAARGASRFAVTGITLTTLLLGALAVQRFATRVHPWLAEDVEPAWRAPQVWARENTPPATRFMTPPHESGWRIGSYRPTYGELRDGGLLFYRGAAAIAWVDRMREMGIEPRLVALPGSGPLYAEAIRAYDADWFRARGIDYVVTETAHPVDIGEIVWSSPEYVIQRVP